MGCGGNCACAQEEKVKAPEMVAEEVVETSEPVVEPKSETSEEKQGCCGGGGCGRSEA